MKRILTLLVTALSCAATLAAAPQPNIIFIFADDWGYGDLGSYGHDEVKTPNIDRLAEQGTRFTRFYVTSGVCSPSRTSVITGHFPARHRVHGHFAGNDVNARRGMPNWLDPAVVTMPRLLQQAGYRTAHFGKWHLGGGGEPHGDPAAPKPAEYGYDETRVWNGNGPTWKGKELWPEVRYMDSDRVWAAASSELAVDATIDFIRRRGDKSFFVNLWLKDPHEPLWPTDAQREPYKGIFQNPKQCYYAVLTNADHHIGRLLQRLKDMGLEQETLVIFASDNGPEELNDSTRAGITAGLKGRKRSLHEGGVRVPFIVRWPGKTPAGQVDETSVLSTVDLLPTFVALAGAELPPTYKPDGEDISEVFHGKPHLRQKPLFWQWRFADTNGKRPDNWPAAAILDGNWKLLVSPDGERLELFRIADDAREVRNKANENPDVAARLKERLDTWQKELP